MYEWQRRGTPKRTRYYQGMIDMDELKKGQYYTELKESFIIFICTFDPFGENLPMYTFRHRCIEKEGLELGGSFDKDLPERERRK